MGRLPITARLMVYSAVMVRIPARIGWIFSLVCKKAVTVPANAPARIASRIPSTGCPAAVNTIDTAAPKVKLPSTVKSATLRIR